MGCTTDRCKRLYEVACTTDRCKRLYKVGCTTDRYKRLYEVGCTTDRCKRLYEVGCTTDRCKRLYEVACSPCCLGAVPRAWSAVARRVNRRYRKPTPCVAAYVRADHAPSRPHRYSTTSPHNPRDRSPPETQVMDRQDKIFISQFHSLYISFTYTLTKFLYILVEMGEATWPQWADHIKVVFLLPPDKTKITYIVTVYWKKYW